METYTELKKRHANEVKIFEGLFWAFNNNQFSEGMEKIGLKLENKNQIYSIGAGGYILKTKLTDFRSLTKRHAKEKTSRLKEEKFLINSLVYELANHEYCITYDLTETVEALGLSIDKIEPKILKKAISLYESTCW